MRHYYEKIPDERELRFAGEIEAAERLEKEKQDRVKADIEKYHQSLDRVNEKYILVEIPVLLTWNYYMTAEFLIPSYMTYDDPNYLSIPDNIRYFTGYFKEHICPWYSESVSLPDLLVSSYIGKGEYADIMKNGLPPWEDKETLPEESLERITKEFSAAGIINSLTESGWRLDSCLDKPGIKRKEFDGTVSRITDKFRTGGTFMKQEIGFIDNAVGKNNKNMFPINMSERQIASAIKQAYKNARAVRAEDITEDDIPKYSSGFTVRKLLFEGVSDGLRIRFWYELDKCAVYTAYSMSGR